MRTVKEMKGITVKNLKNFKGHEGEPLIQGNLFMDGEKIGWFSDDSWGGPMAFHIDDSKKEQEFYDRTKDYTIVYMGTNLTGTDMFMAEILGEG